MILLTDSAVSHLRSLLADATDGSGLRLGVERGGCAGLQYIMKVSTPATDDSISERDGVRVLVDPASSPYLKGCTLDYTDSLADTGFKILNPNAARSCGCGTSFEPQSPGDPAASPPVPDGEACVAPA